MATGSRSERSLPALHLVTDRDLLSAADFVGRAAALLEAGGPEVALHLRAGGLPTRRLHEVAERLARVAARCGALLLVSDRVDVARAVGAGGVQLGGTSFSPDEVREWVGRGGAIGASVHSLEEAVAAVAAGADFLLAGTIYPTRSHPGRPGRGAGWLREVAALGRPVVGIGGITPARVPALLAAGAAGVAVQRGVWGAARPEAAIRAYLSRLHRDGA